MCGCPSRSCIARDAAVTRQIPPRGPNGLWLVLNENPSAWWARQEEVDGDHQFAENGELEFVIDLARLYAYFNEDDELTIVVHHELINESA